MPTLDITRDDLAKLYPQAIPEWLDAMAELCPALADFYDFDRLDWVHLAGQIGAETDGLRLRSMVENMYFTTPARIKAVYSYRLGVALKKDAAIRAQYRTVDRMATALVRQPKALADIVYGGREGTAWLEGSRYIGRGPTQITHRNNYAAIATELGHQAVALRAVGADAYTPDLVSEPHTLADNPRLGVRSAFADYHIKGLGKWARVGDVDNVSSVLNTGGPNRQSYTNNLSGRREWTNRAARVWPVGSLDPVTIPSELAHVAQTAPVAPSQVIRRGSAGPDVERVQRLLVAHGFAVGEVDGHFGTLTADAVIAFQDAHHLPRDGDIDAADIDVLENAPPRDLGARASADNVPGSEQVAVGRMVQRTAETVVGAAATEAAVQTSTGVSPIGIAFGVLDQAGAAISKISGVGLKIEPQYVALIVAALAAYPMWKYGRGLVAARVLQYRAGLNRTR